MNPEGISRRPEATLSAEQSTLSDIICCVDVLTSSVGELNGRLGVDIYYPGSEELVQATIWRFSTTSLGTASPEPRDVAAHIRRVENINNSDEQFNADYIVREAPSGLSIEKYIRTSSDIAESFSAALEEAEEGENIGKAYADLAQAAAIEKVVGLNFVSELEASSLLGLLRVTKASP